jgi:hypothetical protein
MEGDMGAMEGDTQPIEGDMEAMEGVMQPIAEAAMDMEADMRPMEQAAMEAMGSLPITSSSPTIQWPATHSLKTLGTSTA